MGAKKGALAQRIDWPRHSPPPLRSTGISRVKCLWWRSIMTANRLLATAPVLIALMTWSTEKIIILAPSSASFIDVSSKNLILHQRFYEVGHAKMGNARPCKENGMESRLIEKWWKGTNKELRNYWAVEKMNERVDNRKNKRTRGYE